MLPGRTDALGRLHVVLGAIDPKATYQGGIPISPLGQVHIDINGPQRFVNGIGVVSNGRLSVNNVDPIVNWQAGIPLTAAGAIRIQENETPDPKDPYVGGIRIGPNGGVYVIEINPPVAPANTTPPILSGTAATGQVLTCTPGVWTGTPQPFLTYHWERDGIRVGIDNSLQYLVTSADVGHGIACIETANNLVGVKELATNIITIP